MTVRMKCAVVLALVAAWGAAGARAQEKRGPSTPEERARFVEITHKLEASPLDKSLIPDREWALRWLIDVPDVSVKVSSDGMPWLNLKKYKYSSELTVQYTFASGTFAIEHSDRAQDSKAANLAGLESALRAYQAILKDDPKAKSKELDKLVDKMSKGEPLLQP